MSKTKPTLIIDTREQKPLNITSGKIFEEIVRGKLDTGDYSIDGFEQYLCIERKGCVAEFAQNVFQKWFYNELLRMTTYKYPFLLLEFTLEDMLRFPYQSGLSKSVVRRIKYNGKLLLKKMIEIQMSYPTIHIIFCGENINDVLYSICKRVVEIHA